jgi:hypothetical protein
MPPSREDLEFQRKVEEFAKATSQLIVPDGRRGALLLAKLLAEIAQHNERNAA